MTLKINDFQKAAQNGHIRWDQNTQTIKSNKNFFGRAIGWIRDKMHPGQAKTENSAVMSAFIRAIAEDHQYGLGYANLAKESIEKHHQQGKPLSKRLISKAVGSIEKTKAQNLDSAKINADRFSNIHSPDDPNSFSDQWKSLAQKYNLPSDLPTESSTKLADNIHSAVMKASADSKYWLPSGAAKHIAKQQIDNFIDSLENEIALVNSSDLSNDEKNEINEQLLLHPNNEKDRAAHLVNSFNFKKLQQSEGGDIIKSIARKLDFGDIANALDTEKLEYKIDQNVLKCGDIHTAAEMRSNVEQLTTKFLAKKAEGLNYINTLGLDETATANLRKAIAGNQLINTEQEVKTCLKIADAYENFVLAIDDSDNIAGAFTKFLMDFEAAYAPVLEYEPGLASIESYLATALDIYLGDPKEKNLTTLRNDYDTTVAHDILTGEKGIRFLDSLAFLQTENIDSPEAVSVISRVETIYNMFTDAISRRQEAEGLTPHSATNTGTSSIASEYDIEDNVFSMIRDLGGNVPLPELAGRSGQGELGQRLTNNLVTEMNKDLAKPQNWEGNIHPTMMVDLPRAYFTVGDKQISQPGSSQETAATDYNTFFGEDTAGARAVSSITHQGIFADIRNGFANGLGPIPGDIIIEPGQSSCNFVITKTDDDGYQVDFTLTANLSGVLRTDDPENMRHERADQDSSPLRVEFAYKITRESIDSGVPSADLIGPIEYSYTFTPAEEQA